MRKGSTSEECREMLQAELAGTPANLTDAALPSKTPWIRSFGGPALLNCINSVSWVVGQEQQKEENSPEARSPEDVTSLFPYPVSCIRETGSEERERGLKKRPTYPCLLTANLPPTPKHAHYTHMHAHTHTHSLATPILWEEREL
jgi:hypothetical protein